MSKGDSKLEFRALWPKCCPSSLLLVLGIFLGLTALRAYGYLGPKFNGPMVVFGFVLMWIFPWVFLNRAGRKSIGLRFAHGYSWLLYAPLIGAFLAFSCYGIGDLLYGATENNWYQTIANAYFHDERVLSMPKGQLFLMFTIPAILFSPIGEEFLFRGLIQQVVADRWGVVIGVVVNSSLFAGVHLIHHGIGKAESGFSILWVSGGLWWVLMFISSVGFSWLRLRYHSLLPSIVAHAFFNLVMNLTIFYLLLRSYCVH